MGWREVIASAATAAIAWNDEGDLEVNADTLREKLDAIPTPDRIALARELLEGTGRVVARDGIKPLERPNGLSDDAWDWVRMGWYLHRSDAFYGAPSTDTAADPTRNAAHLENAASPRPR